MILCDLGYHHHVPCVYSYALFFCISLLYTCIRKDFHGVCIFTNGERVVEIKPPQKLLCVLQLCQI